jgi:hypothetical protein
LSRHKEDKPEGWIHYGGRLFRPVSTEGASDTGSDTIFKYEQRRDLLTGTYSGGEISYGHLIGLVDGAGRIDMRYHHLTVDGELKTGICHSIPEFLDNGKIRLHERWQWTSGEQTKGRSVLEEL